MVAGALTTRFLVPETRDAKNKSRSLDVLAKGREKFLEFDLERSRENGT
jgi:hypothetical protein